MLLAAAALLGPAVAGRLPGARAHTHPDEVFVKVNQSVTFTLKDPGTCSASASASIADTSLATITPEFGVGVEIVFTVTAKSRPGETVITLSWVGEDVGGMGPCQEVSGPVPIRLVVEAPPEEGSTASRPTSGRAGDPVDMFTGELFFPEAPDLDLGGTLPLRFQRYYASKLRLWFIVGDMGDNWRHDFEWRVHNNGTVLQLVNDRGKVAKYLLTGSDWVLQNDVDVPYQVKSVPGQFRACDPSTDLIYLFDGNGFLTEITDGKGCSLLCTYDALTGKLSRVEENLPAGSRRGLRFTYAAGKVASVQEYRGLAAGRTVYFTHDGENLASSQDAAGGFTSYVYDTGHADAGLMKWKVMPEGNIPWTQAYDAVGKVATQTDAYGNAWTFDYGPPQKPGTTEMTRPDGSSVTYKHDAGGSLVAVVNTLGRTVSMADDGNRRRATVETVGGGTFTATYGAASGRVESRTDALGNTTAWTHAARTHAPTGLVLYDLVRIDHPDGVFETFSHDASGNPVSRVDGAGETWSYSYDSRGRVVAGTNPRGGTTSFAYDAAGNLSTETDEAGDTTTYAYDSYGRRIRDTYADGRMLQAAWDSLDRVVSTTDEAGAATTRSYDADGNLLSAAGPAGDTVAYAYDLMDRLVRATDALGNQSSVTWDALGRFASKSDRRGETVVNGYDPRDLLVSAVDQEGWTWGTEYDDDGNVEAAVDPAGRRYAFARDAEGLARTATSPALRATRLSYDARNRLARVVDGEDRPIDTARDARGLVTRVDAGGGLAAADFSYDANGLLVGVVDGNGASWTYARDAQGRHTSRTDPLGDSTFLAYDSRTRVSMHTFPGGLGTLAIARDATGRPTQRAFSDGTNLDFAWGADGLPASATGATFGYDARRRLSSSNGLAVGRDADGHVASVTLDAGKTVTYAYDGRGQLVSVSDWAGGGMQMTWDAAGRLVAATRSNGAGTTWEHDDDGHVTAVRHGALATVLLDRDGDGEVVAADRTVPLEAAPEDEPAGTLSFDAASRVAGSTYDALGRLTADPARACTWDLASRLSSFTEGAVTVAFAYDSFGLVTARTEGGVTDAYVWNYAFPVPALSVVKRGGLAMRYYVHAPDGTLLWSVEAAGNARRFYHFDEAGTTLFLTADDGSVAASFACTPWGTVAASSGAAADTPFVWLGRWGVRRESAGGLTRMGVRLYDAATRRFLTRDPVESLLDPVPGSPYAYAGGNPLRRVDPLGEAPQAAASGGGAVEYANFGANYVGTTAEAVGALQDVNGTALTAAGKATKLGSEVVGTAATVVSAGIEVYNANERMDKVCDRFTQEGEAAWDEFQRFLAEAWNLYTVKKRITYDQYKEFRHALIELREARLERNRDRLLVDSLAVGTITTLNLLTNLVPGGGLVIDWADHIEH